MRIGQVIGRVTLCRQHPALVGGSFRVVTPLSLNDLAENGPRSAEPIVVYDQLGPGQGDLIAIAEGPEASNPFHPEIKPIDAYNAALLDRVSAEPLPK